ncbi:MAG TPA: ribosome maturation factor RimM [Pseudomonadota bacterium]|nr:ribosome maturation factor RimM [Pseudomonadota bacterium]HNK45535.1 ribosome maturation factor RimM [Pseudomonadota bacterium]HNO67076.1 ribosome maturation factor RimM [Pseudomonadota bacterium]
MSRTLLEIGAVCRPHGLRGELRVKLHDPASNALDMATHLWTEKEAERPKQWQITSCRGESNGFFVVSVSGIADRTAAEALTRQKLLMERADLPELEPGEFYLADLPGCEVLTTDGERVGVVQEVMTVGAQPQLVIARPPRESALIPAIPEFLASFDADRRQVVISPPAGLLDLDQPESL